MLFFLRDTVDIVGPLFGNEWIIILFWIERFFSQRKILTIQIFDRILDFSKETHPRSISFVGRVLITVAV